MATYCRATGVVRGLPWCSSRNPSGMHSLESSMEREEGVVAWNSAAGHALGGVAAGLLGSRSGEVTFRNLGTQGLCLDFQPVGSLTCQRGRASG